MHLQQTNNRTFVLKKQRTKFSHNKNISSSSTGFSHFSQRLRQDCTRSTPRTGGSQETQHSTRRRELGGCDLRGKPAHDRRRIPARFAPLESSFGDHKMRCQNNSDITSKASKVAIYHTIKLFSAHHKIKVNAFLSIKREKHWKTYKHTNAWWIFLSARSHNALARTAEMSRDVYAGVQRLARTAAWPSPWQLCTASPCWLLGQDTENCTSVKLAADLYQSIDWYSLRGGPHRCHPKAHK